MSIEICDENDSSGIVVKTTTQTIRMMLNDSDMTFCCESIGCAIYGVNREDVSGRKGTIAFSVDIEESEERMVGSVINEIEYDRFKPKDGSENVSLTLKTSKGDVHLVLYNHHNGYYSHRFEIEWVEKNGTKRKEDGGL